MTNQGLKTLFLQAPSFEGCDGGTGSGARRMVDPEGWLHATAAVDFVCREEFDHTRHEVATGVDLARVSGLSYPAADGRVVHNPPREFYFRPGKIRESVRDMLVSPQLMPRRLRAGVEFFRFLHAREA